MYVRVCYATLHYITSYYMMLYILYILEAAVSLWAGRSMHISMLLRFIACMISRLPDEYNTMQHLCIIQHHVIL